jgi:hypothetical protein
LPCLYSAIRHRSWLHRSSEELISRRLLQRLLRQATRKMMLQDNMESIRNQQFLFSVATTHAHCDAPRSLLFF